MLSRYNYILLIHSIISNCCNHSGHGNILCICSYNTEHKHSLIFASDLYFAGHGLSKQASSGHIAGNSVNDPVRYSSDIPSCLHFNQSGVFEGQCI